jgi:hypothetical protein
MRADILLALKVLSVSYNKVIDDDTYLVWEAVLRDLTPLEIDKAVMAYSRDPENSFFPPPGKIYGLARPQGDKEEEASLIADRIFAALRAYGTDTLGTDRAHMKIGDLGWTYIENQGGWPTFVGSVRSDDDVPILKAQCRRSIMGLIQRKRSDIPLLPDTQPVTLKSLGLEMRQLK